jgi:hypothetical protein
LSTVIENDEKIIKLIAAIIGKIKLEMTYEI